MNLSYLLVVSINIFIIIALILLVINIIKYLKSKSEFYKKYSKFSECDKKLDEIISLLKENNN